MMNDISNTLGKATTAASEPRDGRQTPAGNTAAAQTNQTVAAQATGASLGAEKARQVVENETQRPAEQKPQDTEKLAENLNSFMQQVQRSLRFSVDDDTGSQVIQVIDMQTDEVVRQIPAEEVLTLRTALAEVQERLYPEEIQGMLFETTA